ncbi:MAG: hypothetical protein GX340_07995 [Clostridiales bacterium]|jgi:hypothetical protein|nr:hypothetical protein [Clostridiales bacterium]
MRQYTYQEDLITAPFDWPEGWEYILHIRKPRDSASIEYLFEEWWKS